MSFLGAIVGGVISAAIFALVVAAWQRDRIRRGRERHFGPIRGSYRVLAKDTEQEDDGIAVVRVDGNILRIGWEGLPSGESIEGKVAMDETLPRSGKGSYVHVKDGKRLFGFWEMEWAPPDTILVHTTFADTLGRAAFQAKLWERVPE